MYLSSTRVKKALTSVLAILAVVYLGKDFLTTVGTAVSVLNTISTPAE